MTQSIKTFYTSQSVALNTQATKFYKTLKILEEKSSSNIELTHSDSV